MNEEYDQIKAGKDFFTTRVRQTKSYEDRLFLIAFYEKDQDFMKNRFGQ